MSSRCAQEICDPAPEGGAGGTRTNRASRKFPVPQNKSTVGYTVFLIAGGENLGLCELAGRLNCDRIDLRAFLNGERGHTQEYFLEKGWREVFKCFYRRAWRTHRKEFEERVKKLPHAHAKPRVLQAPPPDSAAGLLLEILGGKNINKTQVCRDLHVSRKALDKFLYDEKGLPLSVVKYLPEALSTGKYKIGWDRHGTALIRGFVEMKLMDEEEATRAHPDWRDAVPEAPKIMSALYPARSLKNPQSVLPTAKAGAEPS